MTPPAVGLTGGRAAIQSLRTFFSPHLELPREARSYCQAFVFVRFRTQPRRVRRPALTCLVSSVILDRFEEEREREEGMLQKGIKLLISTRTRNNRIIEATTDLIFAAPHLPNQVDIIIIIAAVAVVVVVVVVA